jgi:acylphosphatase
MTVKSGPGDRQERVRVHLRVTGRVQGVFFRASTRDEADRLGLAGWVRNRDDGAVELEAEGPRGQVERLVEWCRRGPPAARVRGVEVAERAPIRGESEGRFRIAD